MLNIIDNKLNKFLRTMLPEKSQISKSYHNLDKKKFLGQFFTSERITSYIVEQMNLKENSLVADLSCGDGAFLKTCYEYFDKKGFSAPKILSNIYGIDIDIKQLKIAKQHLSKGIKSRNKIINKHLISGDTLNLTVEKLFKIFPDVKKQNGFDAIVGNPPYLSITLSNENKNDPIFSKLTFGQVNAATLMIGRAYSLLKEGGRLGLLLPKSILRVNSYKKLRQFLLSNFSISQIIDVGAEFSDVRGEQFILIATKHSIKPKKIKIGHFLKSKPFKTYNVQLHKITKFDNFLLLENNILYKLIDKITLNHSNLENCSNGKIYRGIAIGGNSKYVSYSPVEYYCKGLRGDSIKKFTYDYFIFIKNQKFPKLDLVKQKKIVLQNIFSSESGIIANYDDKDLLTLDTVTNVVIKNDDPYYVLGILNSTLIRFFLIFAIYNQSRLTMHTDRKYIGHIPIPKISKNLKKSIIIEVKEQMKNNRSSSKLNDLIFQAFNLEESEKTEVINQLEKFEKMGKRNGKKDE